MKQVSHRATRWAPQLCAIAGTALLALAALPARAELIALRWDAQGRHVQSVNVAPGKFTELCGPLAPGDAIAWRYGADAPLDFNIHYHEGQKVVTPDQARASAERAGRLQVTLRQDYCWMWSNKAAQPVSLRFELRREEAAAAR